VVAARRRDLTCGELPRRSAETDNLG